jgi:hypothetical protein
MEKISIEEIKTGKILEIEQNKASNISKKENKNNNHRLINKK